MKKAFFLLTIVFLSNLCFGQIKEISAGITPLGHWRLGNINGSDMLSHSYTISKPAFHFGYGWRDGSTEKLIDLFYARESQLGSLASQINHFAVYRYLGYTLFYGKRVQLPVYGGIGLSYYSRSIPPRTKLNVDFGARIRMRIYVTNKIALYTGGYYLIGISGDKESKNAVFYSGLEAGLMFNF